LIETLHTLVAFVVAISLLIAVHEFGHFIVARKLGIKVEKFSIGFGPALLSWHSRDREVKYVIAAIPLGGYVKMLGETPEEEEIPEAERHRAFDAQPVWKRASVAVAGPGFNFIFAIFAYMVVGWVGQTVLPPVIGFISSGSPAAEAGLMRGDKLLTVDGSRVHSWQDVESHLKDDTGKEIRLGVRRQSQTLSIRLHLPETKRDPLLVNVAAKALGIGPGMDIIIDGVTADSPASRSGLQAGDLIRKINGRPVHSIDGFIEMVRQHPEQSMDLTVERNDALLNIHITPAKNEKGKGHIGARMATRTMTAPVTYHMGLLEGVSYGFERTWETTSLTLQVLGKMVVASISPKNLGGPIAIAQIAGKTAELGIAAFVAFLALISVNLGVLNLMPVPVLDGGHLLYLAIEKVRGAPLPVKVMERTQIVGMSLIAALMIFAFYNDIVRLIKG